MPLASYTAHHASLMAALSPDAPVADGRAFAGCLALALAEEEDAGTLPADGLGLKPEELGRLIDHFFPSAIRTVFRLDRHDLAPAGDEEQLIRDLLDGHRRPDDSAAVWFVAIIARRSMKPDHLWQDLGLSDRGELNGLLARHFPRLHAGNVNNMRWKKYFYRRICESEGFVLCTAPSCAACSDFSDCFGDETGLSHLARTRLAIGRGSAKTLSGI